MNEPWRYSMVIEWSDEDQAYIVSLPEWGDLVHTHLLQTIHHLHARLRSPDQRAGLVITFERKLREIIETYGIIRIDTVQVDIQTFDHRLD